MKTALLLLSVLALTAVRVSAADTNLNQNTTGTVFFDGGPFAGELNTNLSQSIIVPRFLDDVVQAMQTYYFSTNYHGFAHAVGSTNAVAGVSYTFGLADCAFSPVGVLWGDMTATRVTSNSTKLELLVGNNALKDPKAITVFKRNVSRTLGQIAKIAESKK